MTEQNQKLIELTEKHKASPAPELNARLNGIERELKHLNAREAATNKAFLELASESRKSIAGQDGKLDETHQSLLDMNARYKKISEDYQRLAAGANLLSAKLQKAQEELTDKIDSVDVAAARQAHELAQEQVKMQERATHIEQRAAQLATDMDSRIGVMQTTLQTVETRLMEEIAKIDQQSKDRDQSIIDHVDQFQAEFYQRATEHEDQLETVKGDLTKADQRLSDAVDGLNQSTVDLASQTADLDARAEVLQQRADKQASVLSDLGDTIQRHYKGFALALVIIAATFAVIAYQTQSNQFDMRAVQANLNTESVAQSGDIEALQTTTSSLLQTIHSQDAKLDQSFAAQQAEIASLRETVELLEANSDNTASRLTAMMPHRQFGLDNTIHNQQWLLSQTADHYVVNVATADNKQDLYEAATRWSSRLDKANLSWIETSTENKTQYTLMYGPIADLATAQKTARFMPVASYDQRPAVAQIKDLLK